MQRYDFDELTKHECADGEWVKASEAEAEIERLRNALYCIRVNSYYCNSCSASMYAEDALEDGTRDEFANI